MAMSLDHEAAVKLNEAKPLEGEVSVSSQQMKDRKYDTEVDQPGASLKFKRLPEVPHILKRTIREYKVPRWI